jgi:putative GTP pyrophosphokinase
VSSAPSLIEQYESSLERQQEFCVRLTTLVSQLLTEQGTRVHSVSSRVKTKGSFSKKIDKKGNNYSALSDVTDVVGLRIVTFFSDDVDEVAKLVEEEFAIDEQNSIDKRDALDPDRFGYLSMHYVASLSGARCLLRENRSFTGMKAEIQIRSILQHAWAEIEHDLGYKSAGEVPKAVRRQFARLAGLLELADEEFKKVRNDIDAYSRDIASRLATSPATIGLDLVSLVNFAESEPLVEQLDQFIAGKQSRRLQGEKYDLTGDINRLQYFQIRTISDIGKSLRQHEDSIRALAEKLSESPEEFPDDEGNRSIERGIAFFYLCHVLAGASQDVDFAENYLKLFQIGPDPEEFALELVNFMSSRETA